MVTTVALLVVFVGLHGVMQKSLTELFKTAGIKILSTYPK